jgi:hypothetical protein
VYCEVEKVLGVLQDEPDYDSVKHNSARHSAPDIWISHSCVMMHSELC